MSRLPLLSIQGQPLTAASSQSRGYAFGVIHHQNYHTHIESNGVFLTVNPRNLILSKGKSLGGVTLGMLDLQERFFLILNRPAREKYSSYFVLGNEDTKILRTPRSEAFHDVIKTIRKEAKKYC
jgi:hypothetical protein